MKVTDRLLGDHKSFRKVLDDMEAFARKPPSAWEPDRLRKLSALLHRMIAAHAGFEDDVFFPALQKTGGLKPELLAHLTHEHKTIEGYLARLDALLNARPVAASWPQTFALMAAGLRGHFKREEEEVFPASETLLGQGALRVLGGEAPPAEPAS